MNEMLRRFVVLAALGALALVAAVPVASAAPGDGGPRVDVIVTFEDGVQGRAAAAAVASSHDVDLGHVYVHALDGFSGSIPEGRLRGLQNDPRVAVVSPDSQVQAQAPRWCSSDPGHPACGGEDDGGTTGQQVPWGIDRIGTQNSTATGAGVHVYVLDTGIDADHADLQDNLGDGHAVVACSSSCSNPWDDDDGHGTHVAGTIGALDNDVDVVGVAPDVTLHAVKVLDNQGSGWRSDVIAGIDWVADQVVPGEPVVVNMSLGGARDPDKTGACTEQGFTGDDEYHRAICNARNAGVVFAVAAGNDGADAAGTVPAAYDDAVLTVSATDSNNAWIYFSNWGNDAASWTVNDSAPVALAAPGVSILSTSLGGGTTTKSGTSMAAPHVAGAAALLLEADPVATFEQVRAALLDGAKDTSGFTNGTGDPHDEDFLQVADVPTTSEPVTAYETTASTVEATSVDITLTAKSDGSCDALTFNISQGPTNGTVGPLSTPICDAETNLQMVSVTYTPNDAHVGTDTFTFTAADGVGASDSAVVSLEVTAAEPPTTGLPMTVADIAYSGWGGSTSDKHLAVDVHVVDGQGASLAGADVTVTLSLDSSTTYGPWTATTSSAGIARFELKNAPSGTYTTTVDDVVLAGYAWDPGTPTNIYAKP